VASKNSLFLSFLKWIGIEKSPDLTKQFGILMVLGISGTKQFTLMKIEFEPSNAQGSNFILRAFI
jgi:hypothetical protein